METENIPMPPDDAEFIPTRVSLLARLKDLDDQRSWQDFFDTYWRMLYSVARRAGLGDAEAQDIVQETIAGVARKMPEFHYDPALGSFKSWLLCILRRRIIDFLRRLGREPLRHHPSADPNATAATGTVERIPDPAGPDLDRIYEEEWQKGVFAVALERVKRRVEAKQFQIFDCYALKNWPVNEVAQNLGVSVDVVYATKSRLLLAIKEEVRRVEEMTT